MIRGPTQVMIDTNRSKMKTFSRTMHDRAGAITDGPEGLSSA